MSHNFVREAVNPTAVAAPPHRRYFNEKVEGRNPKSEVYVVVVPRKVKRGERESQRVTEEINFEEPLLSPRHPDDRRQWPHCTDQGPEARQGPRRARARDGPSKSSSCSAFAQIDSDMRKRNIFARLVALP